MTAISNDKCAEIYGPTATDDSFLCAVHSSDKGICSVSLS